MPAEALERAKAERNAAQQAFAGSVEQVQADIAARSIGGRIADRAGEMVRDAAGLAEQNKGVVAGTVAALGLWIMRRPVGRLIARTWTEFRERNADD